MFHVDFYQQFHEDKQVAGGFVLFRSRDSYRIKAFDGLC